MRANSQKKENVKKFLKQTFNSSVFFWTLLVFKLLELTFQQELYVLSSIPPHSPHKWFYSLKLKLVDYSTAVFHFAQQSLLALK